MCRILVQKVQRLAKVFEHLLSEMFMNILRAKLFKILHSVYFSEFTFLAVIIFLYTFELFFLIKK